MNSTQPQEQESTLTTLKCPRDKMNKLIDEWVNEWMDKWMDESSKDDKDMVEVILKFILYMEQSGTYHQASEWSND